MPAAQRVLAEHGLSPQEVTPTGPGGRILKEDVIRRMEQSGERPPVAPKAPAEQPAPQPAPPPLAPVSQAVVLPSALAAPPPPRAGKRKRCP